MSDSKRVFLIVLDSFGIGNAPDADKFGDEGSNTLSHVAKETKGFSLPNMAALGLGCIEGVQGLPCPGQSGGGYGRMAEKSKGKDTTTGHWELAGLRLDKPFPTYPNGFPREVIDTVGGFPEGMKMAGDLYMWIKIARRYRVCYSPERLARYSKVASNRSATSYTPERTAYSFEELYDPAAPEEEREFIARAALGKALIQSVKGGTEEARRAARVFGWTKVYRRTLRKVRLLNRLPVRWRGPLLDLYNAIAWRLARKGL